MTKKFRLYNDYKTNFNSTIFDLISGDYETKQTKGLAYIFYHYEDFLMKFLHFLLQKQNSKIVYKNVASIEISAEAIGNNNYRADIVIKIELIDKKRFAYIIEAKSIKSLTKEFNIDFQLKKYNNKNQYGLNNFEITPIALTRYKHYTNNIISVTWDELITILLDYCKTKSDDELIKQYLHFLIKIDKNMNFYEKEVLSVAAGKSIELVKKHNIYICPNTKNYSYKKSLYITFRSPSGGVMDKLYKIDDIIILNPSNQSEIQALKNSTYPQEYVSRILDYIKDDNHQGPAEELRFYILSETNSINLNHKPKPSKSNTKHTYYSLKEILTQSVVTPESQIA